MRLLLSPLKQQLLQLHVYLELRDIVWVILCFSQSAPSLSSIHLYFRHSAAGDVCVQTVDSFIFCVFDNLLIYLHVFLVLFCLVFYTHIPPIVSWHDPLRQHFSLLCVIPCTLECMLASWLGVFSLFTSFSGWGSVFSLLGAAVPLQWQTLCLTIISPDKGEITNEYSFFFFYCFNLSNRRFFFSALSLHLCLWDTTGAKTNS